MGHSWGTLRTVAQDCLKWRDFVAALVVYDKEKEKKDISFDSLTTTAMKVSTTKTTTRRLSKVWRYRLDGDDDDNDKDDGENVCREITRLNDQISY